MWPMLSSVGLVAFGALLGAIAMGLVISLLLDELWFTPRKENWYGKRNK